MSIAAEVMIRLTELREDPDNPVSFSRAAAILNGEFPGYNFTKDKLQKVYQAKLSEFTDDTPPLPVPQGDVEAIQRWFKSYPKVHVPKVNCDATRRKVAVVADTHGYPDPVLTQMIIDEKPNIVVHGGDAIDSKEISRHEFNPDEKFVRMQDELFTMRGWCEHVRNESGADELIILRGNHENWWARYIGEHVTPSMMFLVRDPLDLMVAGLDNVSIAQTEKVGHLPNGESYKLGFTPYLYLLGDALVSHANYTGKKPGASVAKLREFVHDWRRWLGWPEMALLIQCHTHKLAYEEYEAGFLACVEPGVGGDPQIDSYKVGYDQKWTPSPLGACVFEQELEDGKWLTRRSSINLLRPYR